MVRKLLRGEVRCTAAGPGGALGREGSRIGRRGIVWDEGREAEELTSGLRCLRVMSMTGDGGGAWLPMIGERGTASVWNVRCQLRCKCRRM